MDILAQFQGYSHEGHQEPVKIMGELMIQDQRIQSLLREKQEEIYRLKDLLTKSGLGLDGKAGGRNALEELNKLRL